MAEKKEVLQVETLNIKSCPECRDVAFNIELNDDVVILVCSECGHPTIGCAEEVAAMPDIAFPASVMEASNNAK